MWHLQRVVAKKKDPLSHVCFLDVLVKPEEPLLTEQFWCALFRGWIRMNACITDGGRVSQ